MKFYPWLSLVSLFIITNTYAYQPTTEIVEQFDNLTVIAFVEDKEIINSPEWNPNIEAPPLSVSDAIKAVKDFHTASKSIGMIKEIEIRQMPKNKKHWHYLIKVANDSMRTKYNIYVVLMSGKVTLGMIQPESYK